MSVFDPLYGHGPGTAKVAKNDRRFHASGTVALNPAVLGEHVTIQLLSEVFDHVVTLRLTVDQHIQAQTLLGLYGIANLAVHGVGVFTDR